MDLSKSFSLAEAPAPSPLAQAASAVLPGLRGVREGIDLILECGPSYSLTVGLFGRRTQFQHRHDPQPEWTLREAMDWQWLQIRVMRFADNGTWMAW
jgi:hypothetical protein